MKTQKAFLILAAVAAGTTVYADKVTLNQIPPAVQQAIRSRAALRPIEDIDRDTSNGKTTYEASWKDNAGQQQELLVDENGQVVRDVPHGKKGRGRATAATPTSSATTKSSATPNLSGFEGGQPAPMNWASETVQNRFRRMANGSNIENFEKGKYNGVTAYEGSFQRNGTNLTMIVGEDGKILVTPRQANASGSTTAISSTSNGTIPGFEKAQSAPMNWASETVQNRFKQMANGSSIENFQKGQYQGRTAYMGSYTQNGLPTTVILGEDGSVLTTTPTAVGTAPGSVSGGSSSK